MATSTTKVRFSRKHFEIVDRAELRRLALFLRMPATKAYSMGPKDLIDWVFENSETFAGADLSGLDTSTFRDGVDKYLKELQLFIRKEGPAPKLGGVEADADESEDEEKPIAEEAPEPTKTKAPTPEEETRLLADPPVKLRRATLGRPPKAKPPVAEEITEPVEGEMPGDEGYSIASVSEPNMTDVEEAQKNMQARGRACEKSTALGNQIAPLVMLEQLTKLQESVGAIKDCLWDVVPELEATKAVAEKAVLFAQQLMSELVRQREFADAEMALVSNALLFLINNSVAEEGNPYESLDEIPKVND